MRFFFDNNMPPRLAHAINELIAPDGHEAIHLKDRFAASVSDIDWITLLASEGDWIIISADIRISKNKHERSAWLDSKLTTFFLSRSWTNLQLWEYAWKLVRQWPLIMDQASKVEPGAGFELKPTSKKLAQVR